MKNRIQKMFQQRKRIYALLSCAVFMFCFSPATKAQKKEGDTYSFSLQQCIEYAYQNQAKVLNAQLDEKISKSKVNELIGSGLPQLNSSFDIKDFVKLPVQLIPGEFFGGRPGTFIPVTFGTRYNATADLTASQLLFDGTYLVGLQASKTYYELSQKSTTRTKIEAAAGVSKAYFSVLVTAEKINLIDANVARLKKLMDDTKAMYDNGFVEKIDLDRITVAYNNLLVEKEKIMRYTALSYNLLKFQMGMDQKTVLTLTDKLNSLESITKDQKTDGFDITKRIEYSLMETNRRLGELDLKRYKFGYLPSLVAYGDLSAAAYRSKFDITDTKQRWFPTGLIGAKITLPIFDGFQKHERVVQAKLGLQKIDNQKKDLENALNLQLISAKTSFDNSSENLKVQKANIELAENVYNVSKKKYEQGVGSNLEVVTAQTSLKEAQDNYYSALYDVLIAKVDLDIALGNIK